MFWRQPSDFDEPRTQSYLASHVANNPSKLIGPAPHLGRPARESFVGV